MTGMLKKYLYKIFLLAAILSIPGCSVFSETNSASIKELPDTPLVSSYNSDQEEPFSCVQTGGFLGGSDSLEALNRVCFACTDWGMYYLYRPTGYLLGSILPRSGVEGLDNFICNLGFPRRFFNNLLQAEFTRSGSELLRFVTNTTLGVGGFGDPAGEWFGMELYDEDLGQTLDVWGVAPGCVLQGSVMPGNVRDNLCSIVDLDFSMLTKGMDEFAMYDNMSKTTFDPYHRFKEFKLLMRYYQLNDLPIKRPELPADLSNNSTHISSNTRKNVIELPEYYPQSPAVDSLRMKWMQPSCNEFWPGLSFYNDKFEHQMSIGSVEISSDQQISYSYYIADDPRAPLVIILPGLGAHHLEPMPQAIAELCVKNGMSVLVISNNMNWELAGAFASPPGYVPDDISNIEQLLSSILSELYAEYSDFRPERRMLLGYSQGAVYTLFMMDRQMNRKTNLGFDRFLAVNPPVNLMMAMVKLDMFMQSADDLPLADSMAALSGGVKNYIYNNPAKVDISDSEGNVINEVWQVPLDEQSARLLIAYNFKKSLDEMLACIHSSRPIKGIKTPWNALDRQDFYNEIASWGYVSYCSNVLLPYCLKRRINFSVIGRNSTLQAISQSLSKNKRVLVLVNNDDFLLSNDDLDFLRETLGDRLRVFEYGGHLGNLYRLEVQDVITDFLLRDFH